MLVTRLLEGVSPAGLDFLVTFCIKVKSNTGRQSR